MKWTDAKIGDKILYHWEEFDGIGSVLGEVTAVYEDHLIFTADDLNYWMDEDIENDCIIIGKEN